MKRYAITGTFHGIVVYARSEGNARHMFHEAFNGESIVAITVRYGGCYKMLQVNDMLMHRCFKTHDPIDYLFSGHPKQTRKIP